MRQESKGHMRGTSSGNVLRASGKSGGLMEGALVTYQRLAAIDVLPYHYTPSPRLHVDPLASHARLDVEARRAAGGFFIV
eukprot:CAMPEP_0182841142 /NCGR_PEP_ID=MMETSP0006_2-20121128/24861_1 /TAXON_ID=97485 /ORGANISM="Prymnesium parvum, Strain Texoma1" /LENGTH=79 /DNA_ID=CAMNT_0024970577 /DNA_START=12 /DNA_END=249 /DNA_ORIENTATION=+